MKCPDTFNLKRVIPDGQQANKYQTFLNSDFELRNGDVEALLYIVSTHNRLQYITELTSFCLEYIYTPPKDISSLDPPCMMPVSEDEIGLR